MLTAARMQTFKFQALAKHIHTLTCRHLLLSARTRRLSAPSYSTQCLVDGKMVDTSSTFDVVDPATGEVFAQCPDASPEQTEAAVVAAHRAFPAWSAKDMQARQDLIKVICCMCVSVWMYVK